MTWGEWVNSTYNIDGFMTSYDYSTGIYEVVLIRSEFGSANYLVADPDKSYPEHVLTSEIIIGGKAYTEFVEDTGFGGGIGGW